MKNALRALAILSVVSSVVPFALAGGNPHCPKCKMELSTKKDKMHSVAVKIKKKTYYCCAACGAHKVVKTAPKKK
ncbi:MAG TPA: hypothetical protein VHE55_04895 [Fimbriimonadaceae bacterium]|nr:hypothetical protein [Fimbriimonadaceae bacterium]